MPCFYPLDAWRSRHVNESGKRSVVFRRDEALDPVSAYVQVPCGKCDGCRAERSMYWSIRMYHEASLHDQNSFITLTYRDDNQKLLDKTHLQDFFRKLRYVSGSLRYFACGEYGTLTRRPHYHAVIFGHDFLAGSERVSSQEYTNAEVADCWGHGLISIGSLSMAACCYVAGYVNKKLGDTDTFTLMSRRPGIGSTWLDKYADDIARTGMVTIEGKELPVPKRYLTWKEEELCSVIEERKRFASSRDPKLALEKREKLKSKEKTQKGRLALRSQKI